MVCKNCHTEFEDHHNYCPHCGAKHIRNRLKPKVLIQQANEQFLSIDNKFLRTFIDLFKYPEVVINGYINGTRKKYMDVLQYLTVALTLVGLQIFLMNTFFQENVASSFELLERLGPKNDEEYTRSQIEIFNKFNNYQSVFYILSIPFYAMASWLVNLIIRHTLLYNFTEHMVLNIYYYGQVIIITAVLSIIFLCFGLNYLLISGLVSLLVLAYHFWTLKRVFSLDILHSIAFYALVMVVFVLLGVIIFLLLGIGVFLLGYLNGSLQ